MTKQKFIIGEEWLYYKIYCGVKTADLLLSEILKPLIDELLENNKINKWFFIRYNDPDAHLRLRFHFADLKHIGFVINAIKDALQDSITNNSIHKIQLDTYNRELYRYGNNTIEFAEILFYNDSNCVANALQLIDDEDLLLLFTLKNTDNLLENFGLNDKQKLDFTNTQMQYFKEEFNVNKMVNKQLVKKYNERKTTIEQFLLYFNNLEEYKLLKQFFSIKNKKDIFAIEQVLKCSNSVIVSDKLSSFIHMSINRTFRSKQRLYEMLCYDFLVRFYKSKIARDKYGV